MIAVIDYGLGNLRSIAKALEFVGGDVRITDDHTIIANATHIVLPGVGAFGEGMLHLRERGLVDVLDQEVRQNGKPFLGVCLGMQLMASYSLEMGRHDGLGWIDASVEAFDFFATHPDLKIPHVGWNSVEFASAHPVRDGLPDQADFYFVHSYRIVPAEPALVLGTCNYGGAFVACIAKDNMVATQFHPEKSQKEGLKLLKNFLRWRP